MTVHTSSQTSLCVLADPTFQKRPKLPLLLAQSPANMCAIRKKYRKMRIKFDEAMRQSNSLFMEEQLADETAKRLAQENELVTVWALLGRP